MEEREEETGREEMNHLLSIKHTIGNRLMEVGNQIALDGDFSSAIY